MSENNVIIASEGMTYRRKHDGFMIGDRISLGYDYSTGVKRKDKSEYYEEIEKPEEDK